MHIGFNLYGLLTAAGLAAPHLRAEAIIQTPLDPYPLFPIIRAVLPRLVAHGAVSADEVDVDTLEQRLDEERMGSDATCIGDMMFGAWAMRPATQSA